MAIEILCKNWAEIRNAIEDLTAGRPFGWLFRGHRNAHKWTLQPSIERIFALESLIEIEEQLFFDFHSKAHLYTQTLPDTKDNVSWLSLMQHHGVPTRLLDWTYSPYAALFFAVEERLVDPCDDNEAAVWAVSKKALDRDAHATTDNIFDFLSYAPVEPERGSVVELLPSFQNVRLSGQQGSFLFNCNFRLTFEESLRRRIKDCADDWLQKIIFPRELRIEILRKLFQFNVHPASLFPDLDGLARFISLKAEICTQ